MKIKNLLVALLLMLTYAFASAQGYEIKVALDNVKGDSIHLQSFQIVNMKDFQTKKFRNLQSYPNSNNLVFKSKESLEPGIYQINADTNVIGSFVISDKKGQKFSMHIDGATLKITYTNSPENTAFEEYFENLKTYNKQMDGLNQEFEEMRNSGIPQYMMQTFVDSLTARAGRIEKAREAFQRKTIAAHPTWLTSSIIQASIRMPQPPAQAMQNRNLYRLYVAEHLLDNFPFQDERFYSTSYAFDIVNQFTRLVWETGDYDFPSTEKFVNSALDRCKVSPKGYGIFFDDMERIVGTLKSPYWYEDLYLVMLRNALDYKDVGEARKIRYEKLYDIHNRNLAGSKLPDFEIKLANDSVINIYSIESDYLLLYFQNPDCPTCTKVRHELAGMEILNNAIDRGKLKVVTIYFEKNEKIWRNFLKNEANPRYIHGWEFNNKVEGEGLFDVRIIPFMFLVDKNKIILKKDLLHNEVEPWLKSLGL